MTWPWIPLWILWILGCTVFVIGRWRISWWYLKWKYPDKIHAFFYFLAEFLIPRPPQSEAVTHCVAKEKHPKHHMFQVIGYRGPYRAPVVLLIGRDSNTGQAFTLRCPPTYAHRGIMDCVRWCMDVKKDFILEEA